MKLLQSWFGNNKMVKKFFLLVVTSIIFSFIYNFVPNNEFGTWVSSDAVKYNLGYQFLNYMFNKYADNRNQITKDRLLQMPIYRHPVDGKIHLLSEGNEVTDASRSIKLKEELYDVYRNKDGVITSEIFLKMPFSIEHIPSEKILSVVPHKYYEKYYKSPVHNYKDKLYFSIVTQALLGYGDIVPASDRVRFLVIVQTLFSLMYFTM